MKEIRDIVRPAGIFAFFTFLSRLAGLFRDILAAGVFGAGVYWDSFVVAFTVPNLFRRALGEGALATSFLPIFNEYRQKRSLQDAFYVARVVFTALVIILIGITIIAEGTLLFIKGIIPLSERVQLIFTLLSILFPYVISICLVGFFMGLLNAFHRLTVPAISPVVLNVVFIITFLILSLLGVSLEIKVIILAFAVLIGGVIEYLIHIPPLRRVGFRQRFEFVPHHPSLKRLFILMGPMVLGIGIYQINVIIDRVLALMLGKGAVSCLYYGNRIIQLPIGIFSVGLSASVLSVLTKQSIRGDREGFEETVRNGMSLVVFLSLPVMMVFFLFGRPIIEILFQHGTFTAYAGGRTAVVLIFYTTGLFSFMGTRVLTQAFYAVQDTKTPMKIAGYMVLVNLILNLILMFPLREGGLALATSITGTLNLFILTRILSKRYPWSAEFGIVKGLRQRWLSVVIMCIVLAVGRIFYCEIDTLLWKLVYMIGIILSASAGYLLGMKKWERRWMFRILFWRDYGQRETEG